MGQPLPYASVSDFRWPALCDPTIQAQTLRHEQGQLVHCRPVLGVLQLDCRLKQAPEQLDDHSAVVGLQQFAVGQGVLAAPAAKELPFLCEQVQAGLEALLGQAPGLAISITPASMGASSPILSGPPRARALTASSVTCRSSFSGEGWVSIFFIRASSLLILGWVSDHNNTRLGGEKLSPYATKKQTQTQRYQQFLGV